MTTLPFFSGDQLRLARVAQALPLEEVASRVAATKQHISQLETGARKPSEGLDRALADALGVRTRFFYLNGVPHVRPEQIHFRKQLTTPISITSQVIARGTLLDRLAGELDGRLKLPKVNFPDLRPSSLAEVDAAALEVRRYWGLGVDGPITSMIRVAEHAGAIVTDFVGLSERVDALSMDRPRPIIVRSDAKTSLARQRFDVAHEVGHLVMHRGIETGDRDTEEQAHRFAGAFLIPTAAFVREFPRGHRLDWSALFSMKLRWQVAVRAIVYRAYDLGVLTAAQFRTANIQLVKTGQAKSEKYDDELPLERGELLDAALRKMAARPGRLEKLMEDMGLAYPMLKVLTGTDYRPLSSALSGNVVAFPASKR